MFILVLSLLGLFSGYNGRVKIKDRVIIQGMAVDVADEGYSLTVQTYKPSSLSEPKNEYELHTADGKTLFEALTAVNTITGQQAFFSNLQIIIISREAAEKGLADLLDFFARYSKIRKSVTVVGSECPAAELLTVDSESGLLPAERINKIMSYGTDASNYDGSKLIDITERYLSDASDVFLPVLDVREDDNEKTVKICGVLCFRGRAPAGMISPREAVGFNWISGYDSRQSILLDTEKALFSLSVQSVKCKIDAKIENGLPVITIGLSVMCNLNEVGAKGGPVSEDDIKGLSPQLSKQIEGMAMDSVDAAFFGLSSDIFEFSKIIRKKFPDYFYGEAFGQIPKTDWRVEISAGADIYRVGKTNRTV